MGIDQRSKKLLQETLRNKSSVYFGCENVDITFQTRIHKVEDDFILLENKVPPQFIGEVVRASFYQLQVQMVRFKAERIESDGEHIVFPLQSDSVITETRQSERFPFTDEERVVCEILNPYDAQTKLIKSVMDMSANGLSVRTSFDSKLFRSGTTLPNLRVLIDGETYAQVAGKVVYCRKLLDLRGKLRMQIGIKFDQPTSQPS